MGAPRLGSETWDTTILLRCHPEVAVATEGSAVALRILNPPRISGAPSYGSPRTGLRPRGGSELRLGGVAQAPPLTPSSRAKSAQRTKRRIRGCPSQSQPTTNQGCPIPGPGQVLVRGVDQAPLGWDSTYTSLDAVILSEVRARTSVPRFPIQRRGADQSWP